MTAQRVARILGPEEGHWLSWQGQPIRYTALGEETGGFYAFAWLRVPPGGGAAPHRHTFHEGFYVLSGETTFTAGSRSIHVPAGGFLNIAANTTHGFTNTGKADAELLAVVAPAGFDRYQREASLGGAETAKALAPKYGIDFHPPAEAFQVAPGLTLKQPGEGRSFAIVGDLYTFLAVGEDTDGAYAFWHAIVPPGGGPPPHRHTREEEAFYVLDGQLTFFAEDQAVTGGPGTFVTLPRGGRHYFRNESKSPARILILIAPAGLEKLFEETGRPWPDTSRTPPPPSADEIAHLLTAAPRYGIDIRVPAGH